MDKKGEEYQTRHPRGTSAFCELLFEGTLCKMSVQYYICTFDSQDVDFISNAILQQVYSCLLRYSYSSFKASVLSLLHPELEIRDQIDLVGNLHTWVVP